MKKIKRILLFLLLGCNTLSNGIATGAFGITNTTTSLNLHNNFTFS